MLHHSFLSSFWYGKEHYFQLLVTNSGNCCLVNQHWILNKFTGARKSDVCNKHWKESASKIIHLYIQCLFLTDTLRDPSLIYSCISFQVKRNGIKENMWSLDSLNNYLRISRVGLWQDPSLSHCLCGWKKGSFSQHKVQILKWTNPNNCTYVPNRPQTNTPIRTGFNLLSGLVLAFSQLSKSQLFN